ncbi:MAG: hypothetical protein E4H19_08295 [Chromatiales bacterium]|jgi:hypothetical protein|nr:MAG: hypothetical protein E4H19_08295 [Chromatiales bacterium]
MPAWIRKGLYAFAGLAALAVAFQVYSIVPAGFAVTPLVPAPETRRLVLLFHGSGGRNEPTLIALEQRLRDLPASGPAPVIVRYVWSPHADSRLRTFPNGQRVGEHLGVELAKLASLESLHLIAHSAGAYVLEPLCESYRVATAGRPGRVARIRMTFLDPIGFKGPFDPGWGARHYGQCADEAEAFINTDDPVPATAEILQHARTIDVTNDPARKLYGDGGHRWPVQYYINSLAAPGSTMERMPDDDGANRGR